MSSSSYVANRTHNGTLYQHIKKWPFFLRVKRDQQIQIQFATFFFKHEPDALREPREPAHARRCVAHTHSLHDLMLPTSSLYMLVLCECAVAWLLKLKGVSYEFVYVAPPNGSITPEFLKLNPNRFVPVITDGGFTLFEGNAIMTYLAEKHQWTDVYPTDLRARAKVSQYLHWHHTNARLSTINVLRPYFKRERQVEIPASLELIKSRDATISKFVDILEQFFVKPYVAESHHATLADYACYCELDQLEAMDAFDFSKYPKTSEWMARMKEIPYHDEVRVPMHEFLVRFHLKPAPKL